LAAQSDRLVVSDPKFLDSIVLGIGSHHQSDSEQLEVAGWRLVALQVPRVILAYPPSALDPMWIRRNQHQPPDGLQGSCQGGVPGWDLAKPGRP
jgi:hypothetical protein